MKKLKLILCLLLFLCILTIAFVFFNPYLRSYFNVINRMTSVATNIRQECYIDNSLTDEKISLITSKCDISKKELYKLQQLENDRYVLVEITFELTNETKYDLQLWRIKEINDIVLFDENINFFNVKSHFINGEPYTVLDSGNSTEYYEMVVMKESDYIKVLKNIHQINICASCYGQKY